MDKKPINKNTTDTYITQCKYFADGDWVNRFTYTDLPSAKADLRLARAMVKAHSIKYKYRLIRKEVVTSEYLLEEE
jgi:hypothetical protein